jgi:RimJ/RimL family protein N-acetyltransferase
MIPIEIPSLTTDRIRLRAFRAGDLDAFAAMRANPKVVRYLGTGRTSTPVEVWRMMATFLGQWALRG